MALSTDMGYLAGIVDKNGADASEKILKMLQASSKGDAYSYGVGDNQNIETFKDTPEFTSISGPIFIGSKNIHIESPEAPLNQGSDSFVFKGMLFDCDCPDSLEVANILEENPYNGIRELISTRTGAYSIACAIENEIICGLDHIGTNPMYFGETADHYAISTNKKMLWALDTNATPLEPGSILRISKTGLQITVVKRLHYIKPQSMSENSTLDKMDRLFKEVHEQYSRKTQDGTVAYSGGVDSTLIAHYISQSGVDCKLITVGMENQLELEIAENAASYHGWDINIESHTEEEVELLLDEIIMSVEEPDPMKVGIAYPFHWASKNAYQKGYESMYSGNSADELFGGYKRYHTEFLSGGDVERMIFNDTTSSWKNNFHRDTKTCLDQGIRLLLPFTHPYIVDLALSIPGSLKLSKSQDCLRKTILRKLAKKNGIKEDIAYRPKKAAQYSTGVDKSLRRIAKRKGLSIRELVEHSYKRLA